MIFYLSYSEISGTSCNFSTTRFSGYPAARRFSRSELGSAAPWGRACRTLCKILSVCHMHAEVEVGDFQQPRTSRRQVRPTSGIRQNFCNLALQDAILELPRRSRDALRCLVALPTSYSCPPGRFWIDNGAKMVSERSSHPSQIYLNSQTAL